MQSPPCNSFTEQRKDVLNVSQFDSHGWCCSSLREYDVDDVGNRLLHG
jgi:hypothetical protein